MPNTLPEFAVCNSCKSGTAFLIDDPKQEGSGCCPNCKSSNISAIDVQPVCRTCRANGILYRILDAGGTEFVPCPECNNSKL
jgi:hypothetical protein